MSGNSATASFPPKPEATAQEQSPFQCEGCQRMALLVTDLQRQVKRMQRKMGEDQVKRPRPNRKLTRGQREAVTLIELHGTVSAAADAAKVSRQAMQQRLKVAIRK